MRFAFLHGWGFDAAFWRPLIGALGDPAHFSGDRGYFGPPREVVASGEMVAVGHSLGALLLVATPPPRTRGMIVINGFDRFTAADDAPGVAPRLVDRMVQRFGQVPRAVLDEFRVRCGADPASCCLDEARLGADLRLLRNADARGAVARLDVPMLVLHGAADPILPAALRNAAFRTAPISIHVEHPTGGHLLPIADPNWCAEQIRTFVGRLESCQSR